MLVAACGGDVDARPRIDREPIDEVVVAHVAARDGLDETSARARVVETLRLVAAARAARPDPEAPELTAERESHLRRTALARLALTDMFEAQHRAVDIPTDDPLLLRGLAPGRDTHPPLHDVCQVIAVPKDATPEAAEVITADPSWRARALELMAPIVRHMQTTTPTGDPQACELVSRDLPLEQRTADGIEVRYERSRFDLDACGVELGPDGSCAAPRLAPEWVEVVRRGDVPGWRGPFFSRFGLHLVLVQGILPPNLPGDTGYEARVRAAILAEWQARELHRWLGELRTQYAAQMVVAEDGPG